MRASQAGFTLIEILIAASLFVVVGMGALESVRVLLPATRQLGARHLNYAGVERLTSQMRAEARSAVAVWASAPPKTGAHDDCDEISFYTADASGLKFWGYRRFPNHTSADAVPGNVLFRVTGSGVQPPPCNPSATGQTVATGVTAFSVTRVAAPQLGGHTDPYDGAKDGVFVTGALDDDTVPTGVNDASGSPVQGGNAVAEIRLDTADASRVVDLSPGIMPSGFTTVLSYQCNARCGAGHSVGVSQRLTDCNAVWSTSPGWPVYTYVGGHYQPGNPNVWVVGTGGYAWDGIVTVTYTDTVFNGPDNVQRTYEVTNWDTQNNVWSLQPIKEGTIGDSVGDIFDPNTISGVQSWILTIAPLMPPAQVGALLNDLGTCADLHGIATGGPGAFFHDF